MKDASINAYDLPARVASYDADMELMHPRRSKMVDIALEVMPFDQNDALQALDLGSGTGYFTSRFLQKYPKGRVVAIDGAEAMADMAKARLQNLAAQVEFGVGDFRNLDEMVPGEERFDVVYTSYALHHLSAIDKLSVIKAIVSRLKPGGWFLNADLIYSEIDKIEERIQQIRIDGIVRRASGKDERFADHTATRQFIDDLQAKEQDKPLTLAEDLELLKKASLHTSDVFWLEYREAVTGGFKEERK